MSTNPRSTNDSDFDSSGHASVLRQRATTPSLALLLENLPGAWFLVRRDDSLAYVNAEAAGLLETTPAELRPFPFGHFTYEESGERPRPLWEQLDNLGQTCAAAWQRRSDGALLPVTLQAKQVEWDGESLAVVQVTLRARELAHEHALEESAQLLRSVIDHAPVIVWSLDAGGRIELAEGRGLEALRLAPNQIIGRSVWDWLAAHPESLAATRRALEGRAVHGTADLGHLQFEYHYVPHFDRRGKPSGATGVAVDITRSCSAERTALHLKAAIEQAAEAVVVVDLDGAVTYVNPAYERSSGYDGATVLGQPWKTLEIAQDSAFIALLTAALTSANPGTAQIRARHRLGNFYDEQVTLSPIRDPQGNPAGAVAVKREVTEQLRWEAKLRQSQKMEAVGQLAGGIAHDFNNLLQIIRGNLELLSNLPLDEHPLQLTSDIAHASDQATKLVRQLLAFSRKDPVSVEPLQLDRIIQPLLGMLRRLLGDHIEVVWHADRNLPSLRGNAAQLEQVVVNLAVNARDAMPLGGTLRISVTAGVYTPKTTPNGSRPSPVPCAQLTIADSGDGMTAEVRERIFEPFFTTKEVGRGTGLGLATVYAITERHGGFVEVDSEPGRGTVFRLYFPALANSTATATATVPTPTRCRRAALEGHNRLLLVAEDDPQICKLTTRFLSHAGFRVLTASNGADAETLIQEHASDLSAVILDAVMPRLRGPDLCARLRARGLLLPCLIVTGYDFQSLELTPELRLARVLHKPFSSAQLLDALAPLLEGDQP